MTDTNYYLSMLRSSIMWLEKYIEVAQYYPDWKSRKQTDDSIIIRKDIYESKEKVLWPLGTMLMLSFEGMLDEEPQEFREELKQGFYQWLNTSQIDTDAPVELKCVLFDFHEILECRFEKAQQDRANRKRKWEIDSPEYMKKTQEVFSKSQQAIQSGKADEMDASRFKGDPEAGKATFNAIANSLSAEEKENFHFWPQMTEQEKADRDRKDKKSDNPVDPMLQSCRTSAISEITTALNQAKLTNADLPPSHQNWETEINQSEDIIEIVNIQKLVLADIKKKKKTTLLSPNQKYQNQFWPLG